HHRGQQAKSAKNERAASDNDQLNTRDSTRDYGRIVPKIYPEPEQGDRRQVLKKSPAFRKRREPPSEEKNCGQKRNREHVCVFSHEEHRKLKAGIFGVKTRDEFRFGFRQIKGHPIRFRNGRCEIAEETDALRKYVTARNERQVAKVAALIGDHLVEIQRSAEQHD